MDTIVLEGGVRGRFSDRSLQDNQLVTVVWETTPANCTDTFSQVYLGKVNSYEHRKQKDVGGPALLGNSIIMLDHKVRAPTGIKEAKYVGLVLRYLEDVCGCRCHATQVSSLIACFFRENQTIEDSEWQVDFPVHLIAQHTQLGYTHLATNLQMYQRFTAMHQKMCEIQRHLRMP